MTLNPIKQKTKRPRLSPKKSSQFVENITKFKLDTLTRLKTLEAELESHAFEPENDIKTKYDEAANLVIDMLKLINKYMPKVKGSKVTSYLESGPPKSFVRDSDFDAVSRGHSGDSYALGATASHQVNYAGDRGSYSQCSSVVMYGGRRENLYSIG